MVKQAKKNAKKKMIVKKSNTKTKEGITNAITKKMLIGEIASKHPKAFPIMFKYGLHCIGCGMTAYETLEQGCLAHGMSPEEIDVMIDEINKAVEKK